MLFRSAYIINKNKKGHYIHYGYEAGGEVIAELRRKININENIIRDLTVKVDAISKEAANLNTKS